MRTSRLLPLLLALPLACAAIPSFADTSGLPTDPRKRLEALQHALVAAAMDSQTRVRTAAWVDSTGKLHENTRITSDMKVRGVRVQSYVNAEDGPSAAIIAESRGATPSEDICKANVQRYRREATLETAMRITTSGADRYHWSMLMDQMRSRLVSRANTSRLWQLSAAVNMPATAYDRMLSGAVPDISPYHMVIELLPPGALAIEPVRPRQTLRQKSAQMIKAVANYATDEPPRTEPLPFVMRLSVYERSNHRLMWQDAVPLFFPERALVTTSQPLPPGLLSELDRVLDGWLQNMDHNFSCRPQQFNVLQETPNGWMINGGQIAGLSPGDQLLLMNREHLPARILEPDSAQHLALVEVVSVGAGRAIVRKLAGPASIARLGDWVATPF
ncbi:MAG: hypothetical protein LW731_06985 [Oxalobacteraceae bacterium]|nr:hypothetical protein [Oxalobacteraceae bacterium]